MYARFFITLFFSMSFFAFAKEMIVKDINLLLISGAIE